MVLICIGNDEAVMVTSELDESEQAHRGCEILRNSGRFWVTIDGQDFSFETADRARRFIDAMLDVRAK